MVHLSRWPWALAPGASASTQLYERTSGLDLLFELPGTDIGQVALGQRIQATTGGYPGKAFQGSVTFVGTRVGEATRTLPLEATFNNTAGSATGCPCGRSARAMAAVALLAATASLYRELPRELSPREDRGTVFIPVAAPEGATVAYMVDIMGQIEAVLVPRLGDDGPGAHVISLVAPRSAGQGPVNSGIVILRLKDWGQREQPQFES